MKIDVQLEIAMEIVLNSLEISDSMDWREEMFGGGKGVEFMIPSNFSQSVMCEGFFWGRGGFGLTYILVYTSFPTPNVGRQLVVKMRGLYLCVIRAKICGAWCKIISAGPL